jgi:hypothetical protein
MLMSMNINFLGGELMETVEIKDVKYEVVARLKAPEEKKTYNFPIKETHLIRRLTDDNHYFIYLDSDGKYFGEPQWVMSGAKAYFVKD